VGVLDTDTDGGEQWGETMIADKRPGCIDLKVEIQARRYIRSFFGARNTLPALQAA
jgi:hypothetical protein